MEANMKRRPHVVMFGSTYVGHMRPMAELARRLLGDHGVRLTLLMSPWMQPSPHHSSITRHLIRQVGNLPLNIIDLPAVHVSLEQGDAATMNVRKRTDILIRNTKPHLLKTLQDLVNSQSPPSVFIVDINGAETIHVAQQLGIPSYVFFTSAACALSVLLTVENHVATEDSRPRVENNLPLPVTFPGINFPVAVRDLPAPLRDRSDDSFQTLVANAACFRRSDGILLNTFTDLEKSAVAALSRMEGLHVYPVGPIVSAPDDVSHECMTWLDKQPRGSVIFVSFGSGGSVPQEQVREIAHGLETSGHRFLWVVREHVADKKGNKGFTEALPEAIASEIVPEGFVKRTQHRGLVVPTWAPQVAILSHSAIGGFVTHCGWNSVVESVCVGVPLVTWPLFSEQRLNRLYVLEELGVGVDLKMEDDGFVKSESLAMAVKELLEGDKGRMAKENVANMSKLAHRALGGGGSSTLALGHLLSLWSKSSLSICGK